MISTPTTFENGFDLWLFGSIKSLLISGVRERDIHDALRILANEALNQDVTDEKR